MELEATLKLSDLGRESADDFNMFFYKHRDLVRSVIWQISGDHQINDLVQEAFIKIWKGERHFRGEANITSWIYRVCVNTALDSRRSHKRRWNHEIQNLELVPDEKIDNENDLMNRQIVNEGLKSLSDDQRTVLVLALIHELKISEIAEILEISEGTVKSRLHYGKENFRKYMEKEDRS